MKNLIKQFLGMFILTFLINCNNDDANETKVVYDDTINGRWELKKMYLGFVDANPIIEVQNDKVIWTFDQDNGRVNVVNNSAWNQFYESGEYSFRVENSYSDMYEQTFDAIFINDEKNGEFFTVRNDSLIIDYFRAGDGPDIFLQDKIILF